MPCYRPLKGFRAKTTFEDGKRRIVFNTQLGNIDLPVPVPCGQCIGCRLEKSRQWAIRCKHEADMHDKNCYITLTYNDDHLPIDGSVNMRHFQLFMKRLRKKYGKVRFFHCGEYGENNRRPHYHACIFGWRPSDLILLKHENGFPLYTSLQLSDLWTDPKTKTPIGFVTVGEVTFQSAAYVARYITKKITGEKSADHYQIVNSDTGEIHSLRPEYVSMSKKPGLGKGWLDQFTSDVFPHDEVIMNGRSISPPKYYDRQYQLEAPEEFEKIRRLRKIKHAKNREKNLANSTPDRLAIREHIHETRSKLLKRNFEKD